MRDLRRQERRRRELHRSLLGTWYQGKGWVSLGWIKNRCRDRGFTEIEIDSRIAAFITDGTLVQTIRERLPVLERAPKPVSAVEESCPPPQKS